MYSTSSISKQLVLVPILVVVATQLILIRKVSSLNTTNAYLHHKCLTSYGKYDAKSKYEDHLHWEIQSFFQNDYYFYVGYGMKSFDMHPKMAAVTFQCRGDSYGAKCRSCFTTAQSMLRKKCLRDRAGIIWYDQCLVEFSPIDTYGKINYDDGVCITSAKNSSHGSVSEVLTLFNSLKNMVVTKKDTELYGAGEKRFQNKKIYVMVQCIKELTPNDCEACISYLIMHFQNLYKSKEGARGFLGKSCSFRFELYPFVNPKTSPNYYNL